MFERPIYRKLLRGNHFRGSRGDSLNFFEFREWPQPRSLGFTGAAAGNGNKRDRGCAKSRKNTDHGIKIKRFVIRLRRIVGSSLVEAVAARQHSCHQVEPKIGNYLVGATYAGFDGAGAAFGQQETAQTEPAARAARTATLTNFIV